MRVLTVSALLLLAPLTTASAQTEAPAPAKERLVVLTFEITKKLYAQEPELGASLAAIVADSLAKRFEVADRGAVTKALKELELNESSARDDRHEGSRLGQHLKARFLVSGRASSFGGKVSLHMKVLDVKALRWATSVWSSANSVEDLPVTASLLLSKIELFEEKGPGAKKRIPTRKTKAKPKAAPVPTKPEDLVKMLASPDAGTRFTAAVKLGGTAFAGAVEPLVKVLKDDKDTFVRRAAARSLSQLQAVSAVPALIECLGDPEYFVAASCHKALLDLTRHDFGMKEDMTREHVNALVEKAKAWWRQNEDEVKARRKK